VILAACDLGSNTLKITVAERAADGALRAVWESAEITRVSEGVEKTGALSPVAVARTLDCLGRFAAEARRRGASALRCVATAGLRGAEGAEAFVARASAEHGVEVEIIDGLREAELAFRAPATEHGPGPVIVIDVGGRSTEIVVGTSGAIAGRVSLPLGGVRLTERFLAGDPPRAEELAACRAQVERVLAEAPPAPPGATMVGVSGTIMALAGLELGVDVMAEVAARGEGRPLGASAVRRQLERLAGLPAALRLYGDVVPAGRADVIVAGSLVVDQLLAHYGVDALIASGHGVRWGLLHEWAAEKD
jgi:exopolyphosphatase/guanosine-5'-triphosphate,3'-diphosphate pyrophosphatase